jgi:S-disulfanyl-L-cysteine oxidoreductase SoxD
MKRYAAILVALLSCASVARAQAKKSATKARPPAPYTGPSTRDGIYTDEQAGRGKDVYAGACRSCHAPASHTGATFNRFWRGKQLSDLFTCVSTRMPKNDPGSLDPADVADVVAYLLKMNALPTGPVELPADVDSLKKIRIEAKRTASTSTQKGKKP